MRIEKSLEWGNEPTFRIPERGANPQLSFGWRVERCLLEGTGGVKRRRTAPRDWIHDLLYHLVLDGGCRLFNREDKGKVILPGTRREGE